MNQYDIVLVNLDPTIGAEIRPCLIISPDEMNKYISTIIIAPMTSKSRDYPTRIKLNEKSFVVLDQIKTIDKSRVIKKLGEIEKEKINEVKEIIKVMLVD
ncbi:growth inhibitor [Thiovulum sp. ES]|nr:growth inhibitor [Thiovulum sp. ES]